MLHLANALLAALLWAHLAALALVCRRWFGSWLLARATSPIALAAAFFFVEHFVGLGRLVWLLALTAPASVWLVWRNHTYLAARWRTEAVFTGAFLYALAWRYAYPDMGPSSERITDLTFVTDYIGGGKLPPVDRWLPPHRFDMYYALQHYAAALIGRLFDTGPGTAYNLGFCVIIAAATTAAAGTAMLFTRRRLSALFLTAAFLFGGVGTAPFLRLIATAPPLHASVRFIGSYFAAGTPFTPFGTWLLHASGVNAETQDLPVETFSYLVGLGDFHPPLSGFLLLALSLLAIAHIESAIAERPAWGVLCATVPLSVACNAWQAPVQAALVAAYIGLRVLSRADVRWKAAGVGFAATAIAITPFLLHFLSASAAGGMALRVVPAADHTPPLLWALTFWPLIVLLILHLALGDRSTRTVGLCLLFAALLAFSEFFYIDDLYGGKYERFNTVLKWWAWIYTGGLLLVGAWNLRSISRFCRMATGCVLALTLAFAAELTGAYTASPKPHLGQLDGAGVIRDDAGERVILDVLRRAPPSIVLQRLAAGAYTPAPMLTMLAGQTAFLGWPSHEEVWRGRLPEIAARRTAVESFYRGQLPDAPAWLRANHIGYILWLRDDNQLGAGAFARVNAEIGPDYRWRGFYEAGEYRVGMWEALGLR